MDKILETVRAAFVERFGEAPALIVKAPGRVNLIGEHTDYNDGFVLPMAIDHAAYIALRPREDDYVLVHSLDFGGFAQFSLTDMTKDSEQWAEYIKGVAWALQESGYSVRGWEGVVAGDVPIGAGLSSSAALEMATARVFAEVSGFEWDARLMAQIGQKTENEWIGVMSGIMDQMISAGGKQDHALLIDCRWLTLDPVPLPPDTSIVILDTATRRELTTSNYNERREQCVAAAHFFGVPALRDVTMRQFRSAADLMDPIVAKRARHIISENERTVKAAEVMRKGDAAAMGELMNESHVSMRDDFEISRAEMNTMVVLAQKHPASYGARMTGGGFGGCAVALVKTAEAQQFAEDVAAEYERLTHLKPAVYVCAAMDGAHIVEGGA